MLRVVLPSGFFRGGHSFNPGRQNTIPGQHFQAQRNPPRDKIEDRDTVKPRDWLTKIDLKDAYFNISVAQK